MDNQQKENRKSVWKKIRKFWDYNKWKVLIVVFLMAVVAYGISKAIAQKELAFSGVLINCYTQKESTLADDFAKYQQIDTGTYDVLLEDNLFITENYTQGSAAVLQSLLLRLSAGEIDVLAANNEVFRMYAYSTSESIADLRDYLDEKTLVSLSDKLYYIDKEFLPIIQEVVGSEEAYEMLEYPDPRCPEKMGEPVPVGIDISGSSKIQSIYTLGESSLYLGIIDNTQHEDLVVPFVEFLLGEL